MRRLPDFGALPDHPMVQGTVSRLNSALANADRGYTLDLINWFDDLLDRDSHVAAVYATRVNTVAGREWSVQSASDTSNDVELARRVSLIVERIPRWRQAIFNLADGIGKMFAVVEIEWGKTHIEGLGQVFAPVGLHWVHQSRFGFNDQMQLVKREPGEWGDGIALDALGRDRFIIHQPVTRSAYPTRQGVLRPALFTSLVKRFGLRWWTTGLERSGTPGLIVKLPEGADHLRAEAESFLASIGANFTGTLVGNVEIDELPNGSFTGDPHKMLAEYCDAQNSKCILGQTMTTDDGASLAQSNTHDRVRQDLLQADAMGLADALRCDLFEPIVRFNWPGFGTTPKAVPDMRPRHVELQEWFFTQGILSANEVRKRIGDHALQEDFRMTPGQESGSSSEQSNAAPEDRNPPGQAPNYEERARDRGSIE